jgi:sulfur-oxidizing protein SoxX
MTKNHWALTLTSAMLCGCAVAPSPPTPQALDQKAMTVINASFREQGIAKLDRLKQDLGQRACSSDTLPSAELAVEIQDAALATVVWPTGGQYLGDWKRGETLAQNGRGMTWTDKADAANGGSCYNCHQISKAELSYGNIGPSLYNYGKQRGVANPYDPVSAAVVQYTWAKLWNSKSYAACSNMPRFGHAGLLTESQLRDVMALLLDPQSPVNQ